MLPQFVILPLAALLVWLALARGIKPLHRLEERIRARRPEDLSPINHKDVPLEVVPLVDSVNDLLGRLGDSLRSEEHTSELQSQSNLVCRLLLEKKKNKK